MIILVDTSKCTKSRQEVLDLFAEESKKLALDIRMQNERNFSKPCTVFKSEEEP